jgi:chromosome segregation ATPase
MKQQNQDYILDKDFEKTHIPGVIESVFARFNEMAESVDTHGGKLFEEDIRINIQKVPTKVELENTIIANYKAVFDKIKEAVLTLYEYEHKRGPLYTADVESGDIKRNGARESLIRKLVAEQIAGEPKERKVKLKGDGGKEFEFLQKEYENFSILQLGSDKKSKPITIDIANLDRVLNPTLLKAKWDEVCAKIVEDRKQQIKNELATIKTDNWLALGEREGTNTPYSKLTHFAAHQKLIADTKKHIETDTLLAKFKDELNSDVEESKKSVLGKLRIQPHDRVSIIAELKSERDKKSPEKQKEFFDYHINLLNEIVPLSKDIDEGKAISPIRRKDIPENLVTETVEEEFAFAKSRGFGYYNESLNSFYGRYAYTISDQGLQVIGQREGKIDLINRAIVNQNKVIRPLLEDLEKVIDRKKSSLADKVNAIADYMTKHLEKLPADAGYGINFNIRRIAEKIDIDELEAIYGIPDKVKKLRGIDSDNLDKVSKAFKDNYVLEAKKVKDAKGIYSQPRKLVKENVEREKFLHIAKYVMECDKILEDVKALTKKDEAADELLDEVNNFIKKETNTAFPVAFDGSGGFKASVYTDNKCRLTGAKAKEKKSEHQQEVKILSEIANRMENINYVPVRPNSLHDLSTPKSLRVELSDGDSPTTSRSPSPERGDQKDPPRLTRTVAKLELGKAKVEAKKIVIDKKDLPENNTWQEGSQPPSRAVPPTPESTDIKPGGNGTQIPIEIKPLETETHKTPAHSPNGTTVFNTTKFGSGDDSNVTYNLYDPDKGNHAALSFMDGSSHAIPKEDVLENPYIQFLLSIATQEGCLITLPFTPEEVSGFRNQGELRGDKSAKDSKDAKTGIDELMDLFSDLKGGTINEEKLITLTSTLSKEELKDFTLKIASTIRRGKERDVPKVFELFPKILEESKAADGKVKKRPVRNKDALRIDYNTLALDNAFNNISSGSGKSSGSGSSSSEDDSRHEDNLPEVSGKAADKTLNDIPLNTVTAQKAAVALKVLNESKNGIETKGNVGSDSQGVVQKHPEKHKNVTNSPFISASQKATESASPVSDAPTVIATKVGKNAPEKFNLGVDGYKSVFEENRAKILASMQPPPAPEIDRGDKWEPMKKGEAPPPPNSSYVKGPYPHKSENPVAQTSLGVDQKDGSVDKPVQNLPPVMPSQPLVSGSDKSIDSGEPVALDGTNEVAGLPKEKGGVFRPKKNTDSQIPLDDFGATQAQSEVEDVTGTLVGGKVVQQKKSDDNIQNIDSEFVLETSVKTQIETPEIVEAQNSPKERRKFSGILGSIPEPEEPEAVPAQSESGQKAVVGSKDELPPLETKTQKDVPSISLNTIGTTEVQDLPKTEEIKKNIADDKNTRSSQPEDIGGSPEFVKIDPIKVDVSLEYPEAVTINIPVATTEPVKNVPIATSLDHQGPVVPSSSPANIERGKRKLEIELVQETGALEKATNEVGRLTGVVSAATVKIDPSNPVNDELDGLIAELAVATSEKQRATEAKQKIELEIESKDKKGSDLQSELNSADKKIVGAKAKLGVLEQQLDGLQEIPAAGDKSKRLSDELVQETVPPASNTKVLYGNLDSLQADQDRSAVQLPKTPKKIDLGILVEDDLDFKNNQADQSLKDNKPGAEPKETKNIAADPAILPTSEGQTNGAQETVSKPQSALPQETKTPEKTISLPTIEVQTSGLQEAVIVSTASEQKPSATSEPKNKKPAPQIPSESFANQPLDTDGERKKPATTQNVDLKDLKNTEKQGDAEPKKAAEVHSPSKANNIPPVSPQVVPASSEVAKPTDPSVLSPETAPRIEKLEDGTRDIKGPSEGKAGVTPNLSAQDIGNPIPENGTDDPIKGVPGKHPTKVNAIKSISIENEAGSTPSSPRQDIGNIEEGVEVKKKLEDLGFSEVVANGLVDSLLSRTLPQSVMDQESALAEEQKKVLKNKLKEIKQKIESVYSNLGTEKEPRKKEALLDDLKDCLNQMHNSLSTYDLKMQNQDIFLGRKLVQLGWGNSADREQARQTLDGFVEYLEELIGKNKELQGELTGVSKSKNELSGKLDQITEELEKKTSEASRLDGELNALKAQSDSAATENTAAKQKFESEISALKLQSENAKLENQGLDAAKKKIEAELQEKTKAETALKGKLSSAEKELFDQKGKLDGLQQQVLDGLEREKKLTEANKNLTLELSSVKDDAKKKGDELNQEKTKNQSLTSEVASAAQANEGLKSELEKVTRQSKLLAEQKAVAEKSKNESEAKFNEATANLQNKTSELEGLRVQVGVLGKEVEEGKAASERDKEQLRGELSGARTKTAEQAAKMVQSAAENEKLLKEKIAALEKLQKTLETKVSEITRLTQSTKDAERKAQEANTKLAEVTASLNAKLNELRNESEISLRKLSEEKGALEGDHKKGIAENKKLSGELAEKEKQLKEKTSKVSSLESEVLNAKKLAEDSKNSSDEAKRKSTDALDGLTSLLQNAQNEQTDALKQKEVAELKFGEQGKKLTELEKVLHEKEAEIEGFKKQVGVADTKVQEANLARDKSVAELGALGAEKEGLAGDLKQAQQKISSLEAEQDKKHQEITNAAVSLRQELDASKKVNENSQTELGRLREKLSAINAALESEKASAERLRGDIKSKDSQISELTGKTAAASALVEERSRRISGLEQEKQVLDQELKNANAEKSQAQIAAEKSRSDANLLVQKAQQEVVAANKEKNLAQEGFAKEKASQVQLQEQLQRMQEGKTRLEEENRNRVIEMDNLSTEAKGAKDDASRLKEELTQATRAIEDAKRDSKNVNDLERRAEDIKGQFDKANEALEQAKGKIRGLKEGKEKSFEEINSLNFKLGMLEGSAGANQKILTVLEYGLKEAKEKAIRAESAQRSAEDRVGETQRQLEKANAQHAMELERVSEKAAQEVIEARKSGATDGIAKAILSAADTNADAIKAAAEIAGNYAKELELARIQAEKEKAALSLQKTQLKADGANSLAKINAEAQATTERTQAGLKKNKEASKSALELAKAEKERSARETEARAQEATAKAKETKAVANIEKEKTEQTRIQLKQEKLRLKPEQDQSAFKGHVVIELELKARLEESKARIAAIKAEADAKSQAAAAEQQRQSEAHKQELAQKNAKLEDAKEKSANKSKSHAQELSHKESEFNQRLESERSKAASELKNAESVRQEQLRLAQEKSALELKKIQEEAAAKLGVTKDKGAAAVKAIQDKVDAEQARLKELHDQQLAREKAKLKAIQDEAAAKQAAAEAVLRAVEKEKQQQLEQQDKVFEQKLNQQDSEFGQKFKAAGDGAAAKQKKLAAELEAQTKASEAKLQAEITARQEQLKQQDDGHKQKLDQQVREFDQRLAGEQQKLKQQGLEFNQTLENEKIRSTAEQKRLAAELEAIKAKFTIDLQAVQQKLADEAQATKTAQQQQLLQEQARLKVIQDEAAAKQAQADVKLKGIKATVAAELRAAEAKAGKFESKLQQERANKTSQQGSNTSTDAPFRSSDAADSSHESAGTLIERYKQAIVDGKKDLQRDLIPLINTNAEENEKQYIAGEKTYDKKTGIVTQSWMDCRALTDHQYAGDEYKVFYKIKDGKLIDVKYGAKAEAIVVVSPESKANGALFDIKEGRHETVAKELTVNCRKTGVSSMPSHVQQLAGRSRNERGLTH